jgi:hypothetical protein
MAAALSSVMILGALSVEWKSIKGRKGSEGSEETNESILEETKNETRTRNVSGRKSGFKTTSQRMLLSVLNGMEL